MGVTDFTWLNKYVLRPVHPFPSASEIRQAVPPNQKYFAKLDCVWGYFQLALSEEDSFKTTFLLPQGRFRYLRAPMGLSASSDEWCRRSDVAVEGIPFAKKIVDDIIVWAPSLETLKQHVEAVLVKCRENNITIS